MENKLQINIKSFKYENDAEQILSNLDLELKSGDILWLNGEVGCGKTTLLKVIGGILPNFENGLFEGNLLLNKKSIGAETFSKTAFCFQHPDNQLLFDSVKRQFFEDIDSLKSFITEVGLDEILDKSVMDLSRGQRKFVALMSTIRKRRKLYLFDEPLDLLDDERKNTFFDQILKLSKNSIIIISSHDQAIRKIANLRLDYNKFNKWKSLSRKERAKDNKFYKISHKKHSELLIETNNLSFSFIENNKMMKFPDIKVYKNEILGFSGGNGCGKTTLLKLLTESLQSSDKKSSLYTTFSNYGFMFQNVNRQLFGNTVYEELFVGIKDKTTELIDYGEYLLKRLNLFDLKNIHPTFLSGGQKQKLVFASLLMHKPEILFLDEIFTNLDIDSINIIFKLLEEYRKENDLTIILTDQENNYLEQVCGRIIHL
jgi:energy-coupling factor transport system ATP-binding protein